MGPLPYATLMIAELEKLKDVTIMKSTTRVFHVYVVKKATSPSSMNFAMVIMSYKNAQSSIIIAK